MPNVTVQGTRHLVEGTLEPIVRLLSFVNDSNNVWAEYQ